MNKKEKTKVIIKSHVWDWLPEYNSDSGVEIRFHRTRKGTVVVDDAEVVVASMATYVSGPYGTGEDEVLVEAPRCYGELPTEHAWRADWREAIRQALEYELARRRA